MQSTFSSLIDEASTTKVSATVGMTSLELWWSEAADCDEDLGRACVRGLAFGANGVRFLRLECALHLGLLHGRAD